MESLPRGLIGAEGSRCKSSYQLGVGVVLDDFIPQVQRVESEFSRLALGAGHHLRERRDACDDLETANPQKQLRHRALVDAPVVHSLQAARCVGVDRKLVKFGHKKSPAMIK